MSTYYRDSILLKKYKYNIGLRHQAYIRFVNIIIMIIIIWITVVHVLIIQCLILV